MFIRHPIYNILVRGNRASLIDMQKFDEIKAELLHNNRSLIPSADIKYIRWLLRSVLTKSAVTVVVECTNPEDASSRRYSVDISQQD